MSQWEQVLLAIIIAVVVGVFVTAMLFYMLIFPLINKIFNKSFPCYDYSKSADEVMKGYFRQTMVKIKVQEAMQPRAIPTRVVDEEKKPVRFVDVHKDVETVRLPKIIANVETEEKLTISKIDIAAKNIVKPNKPTPLYARDEVKTVVATTTTTKPTKTVSKRPTKAVKSNIDDDVKTFAITVPTSLPDMDIKKTNATKTKTEQKITTTKSTKPAKKDKTVETIEIPNVKSQNKKDAK